MPEHLAEIASTPAALAGSLTNAPLQVDSEGRLWTRLTASGEELSVRQSLIAGAEVVASAAYTTNTNTAAIAVPDGASKVNVFIDVTAVGGDANETLDINVEWSPDGGTTWHTVDTAQSFTQILQTAGAQSVVKQFAVMSPHYRLALVVGGTTPSFTLSVDHAGVYA